MSPEASRYMDTMFPGEKGQKNLQPSKAAKCLVHWLNSSSLLLDSLENVFIAGTRKSK